MSKMGGVTPKRRRPSLFRIAVLVFTILMILLLILSLLPGVAFAPG